MTATEPILLPRYRRLSTVGGVLDESIQLYRQHFVRYALVSAIALLPPGLLLIAASAAGVTSRVYSLADLQRGRLAEATPFEIQATALALTGILTILFQFAWIAAIIATTDFFMRGIEASLATIYGDALRRYPAIVGASLLLFVALLFLIAIATGLFIVTLLGLIGSIVAGIGLLVWWLKPGARKTWLKVLIILTAPFGLPIYWGVRWSMYAPAVVLERQGPRRALARGSQLTDQHWFRVAATLTIAGLIVAVLQAAPAALIEIPLTIAGAAQGESGLSPAQVALTNGISVVMQILIASIGPIVYTVLFVELRNRREGTDIVERLGLLESEFSVARR
jgi:hypothetical protein